MSDSSRNTDELIGQTIAGRYRIISRLGAGGMGVAYRAWDEEDGVPVVIKIPKKALLDDPKFAERFAREIRLLRGLRHPHIVPIVDVGEHEGLPYVAMRFLPGGSLSNRRLRGDDGKPRPNPTGMLHLWLPAVAEALDHVHANGVVHRDVKPGNIFFDAYWHAFLGDFGIAKIVEESDSFDQENTLTATNMGIGTQAYMGPEQFTPKPALNGRTDQYALAVMVYEMLAGTRPFTGTTAHLIVEVTTMPVPRLDRQRSGLPASLVQAVHRGLAKNPSERFSTCREFASEVLRDVPLFADEPDIARLLCPQCSNILKLPVAAAGQRGKCPKCQTNMKVADDLGALWLLDEARRQRRAAASVVDIEEDIEVDTESLPNGTRLVTEEDLKTFQPVSSTTPIGRAPLKKRKKASTGVIIGGLAAAVVVLATLLMIRKPTYDQELAWKKETISRKPDDPAANEFLVRHWCFKKDDWEKGLPHLAKSRAIGLRNTAKKHLDLKANPSATAWDMVRLAQDWWTLAGQKGLFAADAAEAIKKQAAAIYTAAVDGLADAEHKKATDQWLDRNPEFLRLVEGKRPPKMQLGTPEEILARPPIENSVGMKLKLIPAGTFMMGSEDGLEEEKPVHEVRITKPFYIGVCEVTNAQWKAVMGKVPSRWKEDDHPVESVSWNDATEFCRMLSDMPEEWKAGRRYRLPTEAEWEYACRAGTSTPWSSGDDGKALEDCAWFNANAGRQTHPVGQKKPNPWGVFDIHGNVLEWCEDWRGRYHRDKISDPMGSAQGGVRVMRGGSWKYLAEDCRSARRMGNEPTDKFSGLGFRLALTMPTGNQTDSTAEPVAATSYLAAAYAKLKQDSADRAANGVIGRHLCFAEKKWPDGLPFLAKGDMADFARAATAELLASGKSLGDEPAGSIPAPLANAGSLVQAARRWWTLSVREGLNTAESAAAIRSHAAELYTANVSLLKSPLDIQYANEWLDGDREFLQMVGNKWPAQRPRTTFAFKKADLESQFAFHGNAIVNENNEIECRGGRWSKAVTRAKFKIPLRVEFYAYAFADRTFDMDPGVLTDEDGGGGIQLHYGTNHNTQTHLYVFGSLTTGLPHAGIQSGRTYRIAFDIDEFRNLTITIDGEVVHASTLPEGARSEGQVSCCGGAGHIAYKGLSVQW